MSLEVWVCNDFKGHYPVGSAAVVTASFEFEAKAMLLAKLKEIGLEQKKDITLKRIGLGTPSVHILCDGDY